MNAPRHGAPSRQSANLGTIMRLRRILVATALAVLVLPRTAHAYLDPGSGSMLLQLIVGGAAGAAVVVRLFWRRLLALLPSRRREPESAPPDGT